MLVFQRVDQRATRFVSIAVAARRQLGQRVLNPTQLADALALLYECVGCGALLRPKPGDCCVFCLYGSVPCPPVQQQRGCCG